MKQISCTYCTTQFSIKKSQAGCSIQCPRCRHVSRVPDTKSADTDTCTRKETVGSTSWLTLVSAATVSVAVGTSIGFIVGHQRGKASKDLDIAASQKLVSESENTLRQRDRELAEAKAELAKQAKQIQLMRDGSLPQNSRESTPNPRNSQSEKAWPYQFVMSKTEQTGHRNVMDLYSYAGDFNPDDLRAFCRDRKDKSPATVFYFVVIFDSPSNAQFPSTGFTAQYALEDGVGKHIRAIYVYNKLNGHSELRYHAQNVWEHIPTRERI